MEALTADDDADEAAEPEPLVRLAAADGSVAGFGEADGVGAGADVAGEFPVGEVEQHDVPCPGAVEQQGGFGAETPAMPDPRPSFWRLAASSFPLGSRPLAD